MTFELTQFQVSDDIPTNVILSCSVYKLDYLNSLFILVLACIESSAGLIKSENFSQNKQTVAGDQDDLMACCRAHTYNGPASEAILEIRTIFLP